MQPIALNAYDFCGIRTKGTLYVDKTAMLYPLVRNPNDKCFFLSRPRCFGKSVMLTTLKSLFQGRRDLFKGLAIDKMDYDWAEYPVLCLNFFTVPSYSPEAFEQGFREAVRWAFREQELDYNPESTPGANVVNAIRTLAARAGKSVVVLVDEYDAPISRVMEDASKATAICDQLAAFYGEIKGCLDDIRFLMLTGTTERAPLLDFPALTDLTFAPQVATLLGYTEDELTAYFDEGLRARAQKAEMTYSEYRETLRQWYGGYRFSHDAEMVYNPLVIAKELSECGGVYGELWPRIGHISLLMYTLKREGKRAPERLLESDYNHVTVSESEFVWPNLDELNLATVFYLAGYLTIKDYDPATATYTLGATNRATLRDLSYLLVDRLTTGGDDFWYCQARSAFLDDNQSSFLSRFQYFYETALSPRLQGRCMPPVAYRNLLIACLRNLCFEVVIEDAQPQDPAFLVARWRANVYLFALKFDGSAEEALAQIRDSRCDLPYLASAQTLHRIGLVFDLKTHQLLDTAIETVR